MISVIVLAAGLSRRMGVKNKLLMPLQGRPILLHTIESIILSQPSEIIVVLGHESERIQALLTDMPLSFVFNPDYPTGMTSSIQQGILASKAQSTGYMICLSDLPFMNSEEYQFLMNTFAHHLPSHPHLIVKPFYQQLPGNPIIFSAYYRSHILTHEEPDGCRVLVRKHQQHLLKVHMETPHCIQDIDTESDYQQIQQS